MRRRSTNVPWVRVAWVIAAASIPLSAAFLSADASAQPPAAPEFYQPPNQRTVPDPEQQAGGDPRPTWLEHTTLTVQMSVRVGPAMANSLDGAISAYGFGSSSAILGADISALRRIASVFWLGGRAEYRTRSFDALGGNSPNMFGYGALVLAGLNFELNDRMTAGLTVGAGAAVLGFWYNGSAEYHLAPNGHASLEIGFTLVEPVRAIIRAGMDYTRAAGINEFDHDLVMDGPQVSAGVEGRW